MEINAPLAMRYPRRDAPDGSFQIMGILCMRCPLCWVTREIQHFWKPGGRNKPAASSHIVCTYCRL